MRRLLDGLDAICAEGEYASVEVLRPWSGPNPTITGEFSNVGAIRWYLERELAALLDRARRCGCARPVRRSTWPTPRCSPQSTRASGTSARRSCSCSGPSGWRCRSTGSRTTPARRPSRSSATSLFTNYAMHVEAFRERFPDAEGPDRPGRPDAGLAPPHRRPRRREHRQHRGRPVERQDDHRPRRRAPARRADHDRALRRPAEPPGHRRLRAGHRATCGATTCSTTCCRSACR